MGDVTCPYCAAPVDTGDTYCDPSCRVRYHAAARSERRHAASLVRCRYERTCRRCLAEFCPVYVARRCRAEFCSDACRKAEHRTARRAISVAVVRNAWSVCIVLADEPSVPSDVGRVLRAG